MWTTRSFSEQPEIAAWLLVGQSLIFPQFWCWFMYVCITLGDTMSKVHHCYLLWKCSTGLHIVSLFVQVSYWEQTWKKQHLLYLVFANIALLHERTELDAHACEGSHSSMSDQWFSNYNLIGIHLFREKMHSKQEYKVQFHPQIWPQNRISSESNC